MIDNFPAINIFPANSSGSKFKVQTCVTIATASVVRMAFFNLTQLGLQDPFRFATSSEKVKVCEQSDDHDPCPEQPVAPPSPICSSSQLTMATDTVETCVSATTEDSSPTLNSKKVC